MSFQFCCAFVGFSLSLFDFDGIDFVWFCVMFDFVQLCILCKFVRFLYLLWVILFGCVVIFWDFGCRFVRSFVILWVSGVFVWFHIILFAFLWFRAILLWFCCDFAVILCASGDLFDFFGILLGFGFFVLPCAFLCYFCVVLCDFIVFFGLFGVWHQFQWWHFASDLSTPPPLSGTCVPPTFQHLVVLSLPLRACPNRTVIVNRKSKWNRFQECFRRGF